MMPDIWKFDATEAVWDETLATLGGHPLQSTLWGRARRHIDGILEHRLALYRDGLPILLARIEIRELPFHGGTVAWIPKGPTGIWNRQTSTSLNEQLYNMGFQLVITDRYQEMEDVPLSQMSILPRTIWIDPTIGEEALWKNLNSQWRRHVRKSQKYGVTIFESKETLDVNQFASMCESLSKRKGFQLAGSSALIKEILGTPSEKDVESRLFVARYERDIVGGLAVIRCGESLHYFWGATDGKHSRQQVGKALQWRAIKWASEHAIIRYDLEGVDMENNPSVSRFKYKMGGREISLSGSQPHPLTLKGRIVLWAGQLIGKV